MSQLSDELSALLKRYPNADNDVKILILKASIKDLQEHIRKKEMAKSQITKVKVNEHLN